MSLRVWLPLNGNLENKGISDTIMMGAPASWDTNGKIGKCATFTGSTNNVIYNNTADYNYTDNFSWTIWIKTNFTGTATQFIFTNGRADAGGHGYGLRCYSSTVCYCYFGSRTIPVSVTGGEWTHLAFTKSGTDIKIYKNGTLEFEETFSGTLPTYSDGNGLGLGCFHYSSNIYPYYGSINDFRIYDHCLSQKEVKEISQGLILHYKLDSPYIESTTNLLTDFDTSLKSVPLGTTDLFTIQMGTDPIHEIVEFQGKRCLHLKSSGGNNRVYRTYKALAGKTYTLSCDYFSPQTQNTSWRLERNGGDYSWAGTNSEPYTKLGIWQRLFFTVTNTSDTQFYFFVCGAVNTDVYVTNFQIEENDHPTPYTKTFRNAVQKIVDSSGYGNDGTIIGISAAVKDSERYNISTHFEDTSSKIKIDNLITSGFGNSYSFVWWAKINSVTPMHWGFANGIRLNGMYTGRLWNTGDGSNNPLYNPGTTTQVTAPTVNVWHHWAMVGNGTKCLVYQDGELWAEAKTYKSISGTTIYINGWDSSTSYSSNNLFMSDFRIYATALSAEDVATLYHTSAQIDDLGGVHAFDFEENIDGRELLALPWTNSYTNHTKTSLWENFNNKGEWTSNTNSSSSTDYIKITPTGNTYYYDTEISVAAGNQFYIGFERYDANKTSRSNSACVYIVAIKPTIDIVHQHYFGTVNLATDGTNPTDTITLRILNAWSGTASDSTKEATIHHLSLREIAGDPQTGKIKQQGQIYTDELVERVGQASIYENGLVGGNNFIEK